MACLQEGCPIFQQVQLTAAQLGAFFAVWQLAENEDFFDFVF